MTGGGNQAAVALSLLLLAPSTSASIHSPSAGVSHNGAHTTASTTTTRTTITTETNLFGTSSLMNSNFDPNNQLRIRNVDSFSFIHSIRGGATLVDDDSEYEDEEEEEEEVVVSPRKKSLSKSTMKAAKKAKAKKSQASKKVMSQSLSKTKLSSSSSSSSSLATKKKSKSLYKRIPYIIRACINPFVGVAMIKAYVASLVNIDFGQEDSSSNLRSALEEKAKQAAVAGGGAKRARKMRPGQAKTLSDLPQLSA